MLSGGAPLRNALQSGRPGVGVHGGGATSLKSELLNSSVPGVMPGSTVAPSTKLPWAIDITGPSDLAVCAHAFPASGSAVKTIRAARIGAGCMFIGPFDVGIPSV